MLSTNLTSALNDIIIINRYLRDKRCTACNAYDLYDKDICHDIYTQFKCFYPLINIVECKV